MESPYPESSSSHLDTTALSPKQVALKLVITSLGLSALIGIVALLSGELGQMTAKILLTSLAISAASLTSLACALRLERGRYAGLAWPGIAFSLFAAALGTVGLWSELDESVYWKVTAAIGILAAAFAGASLLSLCRLPSRKRGYLIVALIDIFALALLLDAMVLFELFEEEGLVRLLGVLSILAACASGVLPVLHYLYRSQFESSQGHDANRTPSQPSTLGHVACPKCGQQELRALGEIECPTCGCAFRVTLRS